MYVGMIETRSLKILLKSFHENYDDLFKKNNMVEPIHLKFEFFAHVWKINKKCEIFTPFANFSQQISQKVWKFRTLC